MAKYKPTPEEELLGDIESKFDEITKEVEEASKNGRQVKELPFKVAILTKASDKRGHGVQVRFSVPKWLRGYANSLMTAYPQAKTPTDIHRACFFAGAKLLAYIAREKVDEDIEFYNTISSAMETELGDLDKIEDVKRYSSIMKEKQRDGIITRKEYNKKVQDILVKLKGAMKTDIGKSTVEDVIDKYKMESDI